MLKMWSRRTLTLVGSLLTVAVAVAVGPGLAWGSAFQRGDVFIVGSDGVEEYSPLGQLMQTVPGTGGAQSLCFDPSGEHLILPGVGLFDSFGNLLPSKWSSVPTLGSNSVGIGHRCVGDGFGHVFLSSTGFPHFSITEYDLQGNVIQTLNVSPTGVSPLGIDLAPDECTLYYGTYGGGALGRFDVCTNSPDQPVLLHDDVDDLRVLPNWQLITLGDLYIAGPARYTLPLYYGYGVNGQLRTLSLDPDGTSFWVCCKSSADGRPNAAFRFDITSGQLLSYMPSPGSDIAVYGPPLLGSANISSTVDLNPAGTAEAFLTRVRYSGTMNRLHVWIDSSSTASQANVGVYSDRNGHPGDLLEQGTMSNVMPGSWNYVDLPSMSVTAGEQYWVAVLGPNGTVSLRDAGAGGPSETDARSNLADLPEHWSGASHAGGAGPLSAYGS